MRSERGVGGFGKRRESLTAYLFVAPAVLLVGLFGLFPVLFTIYVSLFKWRIRRDTFVGIANYVEVFGSAVPLAALLAGIAALSAGVALLRIGRQRRARNRAAGPSDGGSRSALFRIGGIAAAVAGAAALAWSLPSMYAVGSREMLDSLRVTVWYSLGTVPVQLALGLVLAVLINQRVPGRQAFRVVYLLPYVVPSVASAAVFERLFSLRPESLANQALKLIGIPEQQWLQEASGIVSLATGGRIPLESASALGTYWLGWAQGPSLALVSVMIYSWWVFVGYYALIYTNGLANIPRQLYEAAEVDGASKLTSFFKITIPLLSPTTFFLTLLGIIGTFKAFNHLYVLRSPGARGTTDAQSIYIFFEFFRKQRFGYAATLSLVLFAIVIGLTVVQRRSWERGVHYGD